MIKTIPNFENYTISESGEIKRFKRVLKTHLYNGAHRVKLSKEGKRKSFTVAGLLRLVYNR